MRPLVVATSITVAGAVLEGVLAGRSIRARLSEVRRPAGSPSFPLWIAIGFLYYATCFGIAYRLTSVGSGRAVSRAALAVLVAVVIGNALWNYAFFRRRDLRLTWRIAVGYALLAIILAGLLLASDRTAALMFAPYLTYLVYGTWWTYATWRLNS